MKARTQSQNLRAGRVALLAVSTVFLLAGCASKPEALNPDEAKKDPYLQKFSRRPQPKAPAVPSAPGNP